MRKMRLMLLGLVWITLCLPASAADKAAATQRLAEVMCLSARAAREGITLGDTVQILREGARAWGTGVVVVSMEPLAVAPSDENDRAYWHWVTDPRTAVRKGILAQKSSSL